MLIHTEFPKGRKDERNKVFNRMKTTNNWKWHQTQNDIVFEVICECGHTKWVLGGNLRRKKPISCLCQKYINHYKKKDSKYFFNSFLFSYANNSKAKNVDFNINLNDLDYLYEKQKGLCYYTKENLTIPEAASQHIKNTKKFDAHNYNISIDRINPNIGYLKDNIVFCLSDINMIKYTFDTKTFYMNCKMVSSFDSNFQALKNLVPLNFNSLFSKFKKRAIIKNIDFSILLTDIQYLYQRQGAKCYLSGEDLWYQNYTNTNISIDRINSQEGYHLNNIALCTKNINLMKNSFDIEYFKQLCTLVSENYTPK